MRQVDEVHLQVLMLVTSGTRSDTPMLQEVARGERDQEIDV